MRNGAKDKGRHGGKMGGEGGKTASWFPEVEADLTSLDLRISPASVEALANDHCGPMPEGARLKAGSVQRRKELICFGVALDDKGSADTQRGGEDLVEVGPRSHLTPSAAQRADGPSVHHGVGVLSVGLRGLGPFEACARRH